MLQCKIFSGSDPYAIERDVNRFLNDHAKVMVHSILQSAGTIGMQLTIFFNVRTRAAKMKEANIEEATANMINIKQSEIPSN